MEFAWRMESPDVLINERLWVQLDYYNKTEGDWAVTLPNPKPAEPVAIAGEMNLSAEAVNLHIGKVNATPTYIETYLDADIVFYDRFTSAYVIYNDLYIPMSITGWGEYSDGYRRIVYSPDGILLPENITGIKLNGI